MDLERCHYIVVEGPIGAGKTSLARQLAEHLQAELLLEQPETIRSCRASTTTCRVRAAHAAHVPFSGSTIAAGAQLDLFRDPCSDFLFDRSAVRAPESPTTVHSMKNVPAPETANGPGPRHLSASICGHAAGAGARVASIRAVDSRRVSRAVGRRVPRVYQYDEAPLLIINSERLNFVDNPPT
jgi:hypothetical protein